METVIAYWPLIAFAATVVVLPAIAWAIRMGLASKADLGAEAIERAKALVALEGRLTSKLNGVVETQGELSDRTLRIETEIRHLPSADDIADLKTAAARTEALISSMTREFSAIAASVTRIENQFIRGRDA